MTVFRDLLNQELAKVGVTCEQKKAAMAADIERMLKADFKVSNKSEQKKCSNTSS